MFEIGNSLHEARVRQSVTLQAAEIGTKIRAKYLKALEEEQFDALPAQTYVKGFLRTYADFLGLDGQLYVDEFNSRFVAGEERDQRPRRSRTQPRRSRRVETNVVLVALVVIVVLTVVVISAWKWSGGGSSSPPKPAAPAVHPSRSRAALPLLTVVAKHGSTHVTARRGGASGDIAYDGTVQKGDAPVAIRGTRLWVQIDSPENLRVIVKGHTQVVPGSKPGSYTLKKG